MYQNTELQFGFSLFCSDVFLPHNSKQNRVVDSTMSRRRNTLSLFKWTSSVSNYKNSRHLFRNKLSSLYQVHTMNVFWAVFKLSCWILFLYQAWRCVEQFLQQTTTRIDRDTQTNIPSPLICLGSQDFNNQSGTSIIQKSVYDKGNITNTSIIDILFITYL